MRTIQGRQIDTYLIITGWISILGQVVMLRELIVACYGIELIYILSMGVWMFWTATGAWIGRKSVIPSLSGLAVLMILISLVLPGMVVLIRGSRGLFQGVAGSYLPFHHQMVVMAGSLFCPGLLLGMMFQWAAKISVNQGHTLARAYGIEGVGGVLGGCSATLFMAVGMSNFVICLLGAFVTSITALVLCVKNLRTWIFWISVGLGILLTGVWIEAPEIDMQMTRWNHPNVLATRDTPYCRITLTGLLGQLSLFENDVLDFETESTEPGEFVHLAAIQHPRPRNVLVAGGGISGILSELLKHHPEKIDYLELDPMRIQIAKTFFPTNLRQSLHHSSVRIRITDPRQFLPHAGTYDLILIGMAPPMSGQSNRFYTREFFASCAKKLSADGIFAFRLPSSENIWTHVLTHRNGSIYRALRDVFKDVLVLPGTVNLFLAANSPLIRDPNRLIHRFESRGIHHRLVSPPFIQYLYTNDRFAEINGKLAQIQTPANTDTRPVCYAYSIVIWMSKMIPNMINPSLFLPKIPLFWAIGFHGLVLIIAIGWFASVRHNEFFRRSMIAFMAGFLGMILETLLMLHYQVKSGVLYQNLGILLMTFMGGLTLGALGYNRIFIHADGRACPSDDGHDQPAVSNFQGPALKLTWIMPRIHEHWIGLALWLGCFLLGMGVICLLTTGADVSLALTGCLLFVNGCLVAGIFSHASQAAHQLSVISPLYAADLAGGCLGSVLASLLLIPLLGMIHTTVLTMILALAGMVLIRK